MELVPVELTVGAARALTFGANKYTAGNWKLCEYWSRYLGALLRHITAWQAGENLDPETGYSHLDCAAACLSFLMAFEARGLGTDDRGDL